MERGAKGLAEGASLGRHSGRLWAAGEPPHDVLGEDVGFPPVIVVKGDLLLYRRGHVDEGVPGAEEFFVRERGGRVSFFSVDFQRVLVEIFRGVDHRAQLVI